MFQSVQRKNSLTHPSIGNLTNSREQKQIYVWHIPPTGKSIVHVKLMMKLKAHSTWFAMFYSWCIFTWSTYVLNLILTILRSRHVIHLQMLTFGNVLWNVFEGLKYYNRYIYIYKLFLDTHNNQFVNHSLYVFIGIG